jgi:hypothetical protein
MVDTNGISPDEAKQREQNTLQQQQAEALLAFNLNQQQTTHSQQQQQPGSSSSASPSISNSVSLERFNLLEQKVDKLTGMEQKMDKLYNMITQAMQPTQPKQQQQTAATQPSASTQPASGSNPIPSCSSDANSSSAGPAVVLAPQQQPILLPQEQSVITAMQQQIRSATGPSDSVSSFSSSLYETQSDSTFAASPALLPSASGSFGTDPLAVVKQALSFASRSRRPFHSVKELKQALTEAAQAAKDVETMNYRYKYLNTVIGWADIDLGAAQDYHFHVAREEQHGRHTICAPGGHLHNEAFIEHILPIQLNSKRSAAISHNNRSAQSDKKRPRNSASSYSSPGGPSASFPAGSCTFHPSSTTHNTESCRRNTKKPRSQ